MQYPPLYSMLKYSVLWKGTYMWVQRRKIILTSGKKKTQHLKHKGNILEVSLLKQMTGIHRELSSEKL